MKSTGEFLGVRFRVWLLCLIACLFGLKFVPDVSRDMGGDNAAPPFNTQPALQQKVMPFPSPYKAAQQPAQREIPYTEVNHTPAELEEIKAGIHSSDRNIQMESLAKLSRYGLYASDALPAITNVLAGEDDEQLRRMIKEAIINIRGVDDVSRSF